MSQHSSLKARGFGVRHRNFLKRFERIKKLKLDERWKEEMSVYGLPKVKSLKVKVKKVKEPKAEAAAEGAQPAAPQAQAAQPAKQAAKPKAGK